MSTRGARAAPSEAPGPADVRLRLPLLRERLESIDAAGRQRWLDFGRVQPVLLERLSEGPHGLVVADLEIQEREGAPPVSLHLLERDPRPQAFDALLTWDWFNHLDADALRRIGARLARHAAPGALLHALIHYSSDAMPARPMEYRLLPDGDVLVIEVPPGPQPAPRYSPKALEKAMPQWQVDRTMLLNNGMQEFLIRRRSDD